MSRAQPSGALCISSLPKPLSLRSCCYILNNFCICQKSVPAYLEHRACDPRSALSVSERVLRVPSTPLMPLVPRVSLGFPGQTGDLGSMPYWAKHLKQSKCNSLLAIVRGSEYHYWASVEFDWKMPTGPSWGQESIFPCRQTARALSRYFTARG